MNPDILKEDKYEEELKSGGALVITKTFWRIEYLFKGKDRRFLCKRYFVDGTKIDEYISAWKNNFEKFRTLKRNLSNSSGEFKIKGEKNMVISVGGEYPDYTEGVCLEIYYDYQQRIRNEAQLERLIEDYEMAKEKASTIQEILNQV